MKNIVLACWLAAAMAAFGQAPVYPYAVKAFAGANPLGDGGPAAQALLFSPSAVALDLTGNIFILDSSNYRIRKIGVVDGKISTIAQLQLYGNDMKLGADGFFYVTASAAVLKVSPTGAVTIIAGTGSPGPIVDEIAATSATIRATGGIALDSMGQVYFSEGNRVRKITSDGIIHTVAGLNTGSDYNGDNRLATTAALSSPLGLAIDN